MPRKYRSIIEYWKAEPRVRYEVLCAQLRDWQRFQKHQARARSYGKEDFGQYTHQIRIWTQSRAIGLTHPIPLHWDPSVQDEIHNWIEFAHYHHKNQEALTERLDAAETNLDQASGVSEDDSIASENRRDYYGRLVKQHASLMQWIEKVLSSRQAEFVLRDRPQNGTGRNDVLLGPPSTTGKVSRLAAQIHESRMAKTRKSQLRAKTAKGTTSHRHRAEKTQESVRYDIPKVVKTRSGRVSRRPTRWIPG